MPKIKLFTGIKYCIAGEVYKFKNGVAIVPGMTISRKQVLISVAEFKELNTKEK